MGHHVRPLLLVVVFLGAATAMAASGEDGMPPLPKFQMDFPPLPSPADMPVPPLPSLADMPVPPLPSPADMPMPPLPSPADMPVTPPCLNSTSTVCASVHQDNSTLAPCCAAVKELYDSDRACLCDAVGQAQKIAKQYGLNGTLDGLEMFRQCKMPTSSCDPGTTPGSQNKGNGSQNIGNGSQSIGNGAPSGSFIGAFQIMLLLPLLFVLWG